MYDNTEPFSIKRTEKETVPDKLVEELKDMPAHDPIHVCNWTISERALADQQYTIPEVHDRIDKLMQIIGGALTKYKEHQIYRSELRRLLKVYGIDVHHEESINSALIMLGTTRKCIMGENEEGDEVVLDYLYDFEKEDR